MERRTAERGRFFNVLSKPKVGTWGRGASAAHVHKAPMFETYDKALSFLVREAEAEIIQRASTL